ncbi:unnamed protein product [Parajaminaea phylloscopi]
MNRPPWQQQGGPDGNSSGGLNGNGGWTSTPPRAQGQQQPQPHQPVLQMNYPPPPQQQQKQQQQRLPQSGYGHPAHPSGRNAAGQPQNAIVDGSLYPPNVGPQHERQHSQQQPPQQQQQQQQAQTQAQQQASQQHGGYPPRFNAVPPTHFNTPQQGWQAQMQSSNLLDPTFDPAAFNFGVQGGVQAVQQQYPVQHAGPVPGAATVPQQMPAASTGVSFKTDDDDELRKAAANGAGPKTGTSDFVKKLFTMLDDASYSSIVSWSHTGDSFVVRNMNDFTKHILPRHFRHSNFASFVRQLNKYDFHKVKNPEEQAAQPTDQVWEFKHPDFIRGREDLLENVRRKTPSGKKKGLEDRDLSPTVLNPSEAADRGAEEYQQLKDQIATLTAAQDQMSSHITNLTKQYQGVIGEMLTFQRNMVQQDQLMQNLIQYLMNLESDRKVEAAPSSQADGPFLPAAETAKLISSYEEAARASFGQMSEISQRAAQQSGDSARAHPSAAGVSMSPTSQGPGSSGTPNTSVTTVPRPSVGNLSPKSFAAGQSPAELPPRRDGLAPSTSSSRTPVPARNSPGAADDYSMFLHPPHIDDNDSNTLFNTAANIVDNPSLAAFEGAGLKVFTVGTLQPREGSGEHAGPSASSLAAAFGRAASGEGSDAEKKQEFGLSVPTLESLPADMPKVDKRTTSTNPTPNPHAAAEGQGSDSRSGTPSEGGSNLLRVRRSTYVPGWAVPPRVLLVDDDAVCRKLSSKFLQVFGCAIDVAVDGVNAVNKMNLEQYDLVLMDIVMPNLDGVSATSLIREFDPRTPIISMTSNSAPQELINYMSSGMNDILPKPFTKEGLLNVLEKHLIHLKTVQKMDQIPKQLGLPPVSKETLQDVLKATAASATASDPVTGASLTPLGRKLEGIRSSLNGSSSSSGPRLTELGDTDTLEPADLTSAASPPSTTDGNDDGNVVNPLAGMGFSDEEYISMVQSLIAAGSVSGDMSQAISGAMGVELGEGTSRRGSRIPDDVFNASRKRGAELTPSHDASEPSSKKTRGDVGRFPDLA